MESFLTSHGEPLEQGMVDLVFASYDVNSDGRISLDEFKVRLT